MKKRIIALLIIATFTKATAQTKSIDSLLQKVSAGFVQSINQEEIQHNTGKTLAQLLSEQPGIVVNGAYQPKGTLTNIYLEGSASGRPMIALDGIPIWDPSSINDYYDLNFIPLSEIEQIDIYKGAKTNSFGEGAIAGIINIITQKKNIATPLNLNATQQLGNRHNLETNLKLYGKIKKLTYSTSYTKQSTDGFSYAFDNLGNKNFDKDGFNGNYFNTFIAYTPSTYWLLKARCLFSEYKADSDVNDFVDGLDYYYKNKNLAAGADFSYHKKSVLMEGSYQYGKTERHYYYDPSSNEHFTGNTFFAVRGYNSFLI